MTVIDEKELTINITESLSFEHTVQPVYDDFYYDIQTLVEERKDKGDSVEDDYELAEMEKFLAYELTKEDKLEILENIKEEYDYESYRSDCIVSLFDEDGINKAISYWIDANFGFNYERF